MAATTQVNTNLVGRKIHILTDEEARQEAELCSTILLSETIASLTAGQWYPVLNDKKWTARRGVTGEIVAVHLDAECKLIYTCEFDGRLIEVPDRFFRVEPR